MADLALINLALGHLGEPSLRSVDLTEDPPSPTAAKVLPIYGPTAKVAQSKAPWLCCLQWATLSVAADIPGDWKHPYVFRLPDGALQLWELEGVPVGSAWARGVHIAPGGETVRVLRAQVRGPLQVSYTRATPEAGWDDALRDAFAYELAGRIAGPLQADAELGAAMRRAAKAAFAEALGSEAGQDGGQVPSFGMGPVAAARAQAL